MDEPRVDGLIRSFFELQRSNGQAVAHADEARRYAPCFRSVGFAMATWTMTACSARPSLRRLLAGASISAFLHLAVLAVLAYPGMLGRRSIAASARPILVELKMLAEKGVTETGEPSAPRPALPGREKARDIRASGTHRPLPFELRVANVDSSASDAPAPLEQSIDRAPPAESVAAAVADTARPSSDGASDPPSMTDESSWEARLIGHLGRFKHYPYLAQRTGQQDVVYATVVMDRLGRVLACEIARSRGFEALDREVHSLFARAFPLPAPPSEVPGDKIARTIPIKFLVRPS
ncbi:energy transducer TonB [Paucibacter sp. R3-3]|uniref:Energy transducer TonB n=1 Tax=Roseateles agri TaxID=3098619 RepID=A0ABU5DSB8_9BURK|nr:energy transducer TonB [Paucibacter sp. R3-3]MDY0749034.1 energy transducer TonB [Paucibacter sp. R3-3]